MARKIDGKVEYLSKDYRTAKRKLRALVDAARNGSLTRDWLEVPFATLADEYQEDIKARRAPGTYRNYREQLLRAIGILGSGPKVGQLRRIHLAKIEQKMTGSYSPATIRDTISVVQQVFNWAIRNDLLVHNPLAGYQKPTGRGRTRLLTDDEFQALLRHADVCFRRFLVTLRLTGCRPGELRKLTWEMVNFEEGLWVIGEHKTITTQQDPLPRVIPLPNPIWKLCHRLSSRSHRPTDHVFLNMQGQPYTKDCVVRKMDRLRNRAKIEKKAGENIVLYTNRHTYATQAVGRVSDTELAELMGHTTTRTLRRYVHLNANRLRDIQRRIQS